MTDGEGKPDKAIITPGISIRAAGPDDSANTRAIQWAVGWQEAPDFHKYWPTHDSDWIANRHFREFVAEVDGVVAGRLGLEAFVPPFAELVNLCVRPDFRRLGIGEMLTMAAQRTAARMGFPFLFLQTEMDNTAAHTLYAGQDWVPTAHGKMLRMVKLIDYPILASFKRTHPLNQYHCVPAIGAERTWEMEWHAFVTDDYLRLRLESGASQSDSAGMAPAISGLDWRIKQGARSLRISLEREPLTDIEPGHHVEIVINARNSGTRPEEGVFQMVLPHGVRVTSPNTNTTKSLLWSLEPGESLRLPVVIQIEPHFDASALWYLNYGSLPISVEAYWQDYRALLSTSLPMAIPAPLD